MSGGQSLTTDISVDGQMFPLIFDHLGRGGEADETGRMGDVTAAA
jgi:hypothetical protein